MCVLKVMGLEATEACKDDQLCALLKALFDGVLHRVKYIYDANFTKENWEFLLVDTKNTFNEMNIIIMFCTVHHLWPSGARFILNCYRQHYLIILKNGDGTSNIIHSRECHMLNDGTYTDYNNLCARGSH